MWIRHGFLIFIGLASGFVIAGGLYSFITMVGVLTRLATRTNTAKRVMLYEDMVTLGAAVGNWFSQSPFSIPFGPVIPVSFGIFGGIFTGCLAIALAEVLNVIPTFTRRVKLKKGLTLLLVSMALAKIAGTFYQLVIMGNK